ncbi:MAG: 3-deoxy-manno-octulosonate cytidylyltransferase [Planctomycetota bacterium]
MRTLLVIPARLASTRLPEKLLRTAGGKSILQHTYESAQRANAVDEIVIAVDDERLAEAADSFGARWVMTSVDCPSGTDRIAEVAEAFTDADIFVNVQGDEPEIDPAIVDSVTQLLKDHPEADIATAGVPIQEMDRLDDPGCVKIVMASEESRAVYFSRAAVPFCRDGLDEQSLKSDPPMFWHHLGLYSYRRDFLLWFARQPPSPLEQMEKLEQLRAVEAGKTVLVARAASATLGIDTEDDLQSFIHRVDAR